MAVLKVTYKEILQRDRLVLDSATADVILKIKRFPLLFSHCCPCYAEIGPCYSFRGISLENPYGIGVC
jgi:hypothetical protein